ncbi:HCNGP-like protein-domain-containing protein [Coprinopsis sp. MPI-PUGE-AT-0042]|nr:HCNGP-like protein-domain-containing protein [Coprinopsis sp. MPI-PUGE-AT-0042]
MDLDDSPRPANTTNGEAQEEEDEISKIRRLLRPAPIAGVENWGVPDALIEEVELGVANTVQKFFALKHPPSNGQARHFNDSLIQNRSFRNPHIYKKLVDWAGIGDEKTSNFPPEIWDASGTHGALLPEYYADNVAAQQKSREEKRERAQTSSSSSSAYNSTRTIDFSSSTNPISAGGGRQSHHHSSSSRQGERRGDRAKGATRWG